MKLPKRKQLRLKNYDYSQEGAYFITICTNEKNKILWNVGATFGRPQDKSHFSEYGLIIDKEIEGFEGIYKKDVIIDKYVIMPNHIHMIILMHYNRETNNPLPTISRVIQQFKGAVTKQAGLKMWQKSFYDHVIRNESDYREICEYIDVNPIKWEYDCYF